MRKLLIAFIRYETTHERAFDKPHREIVSIRQQKRNLETGFESQKLATEDINVRKDAQILKCDQFDWKKMTFQIRKESKERRTVTVEMPVPEPAPTETGTGSLKMAA